jgi:4-amino-4-deoxy-L-arabinose transferase-like glycosyltransferase
MSDHISAAGRLDRNSLIKAMLIFGVAFVAYLLTRSPGLDEYDSVQFAMGVRDFNLWEHQPHPPGYPLFIFFGWIGGKVFGASPEDSLHFVSSLGGAFFVAAWFFIIRLQFNQRLAWWVAACLAITPVVWMTSTKVMTDSLAAGFLSAEIAAAIWLWQRGRGVALCAVCLFGAAAAGTRPQLIAVVFVILFLALRKGADQMKMSIFAVGALIAGCLLWLVPTWHSQVGLRDSISPWLVYPQTSLRPMALAFG